MIAEALYWGEELNRCSITTPKGEQQVLTVPIYGARRQQPYREIRICNMHAWQRQHWAALYSAYGKKPYWEYYCDYIRPLYHTEYEYLYQLNEQTEYILRCLINNVMPATAPCNMPLAPNAVSAERIELGEAVTPEKGLCSHILDHIMEYGPETIFYIKNA